MYPDDCKYTKEHEWIRAEGGLYAVGITSFAAEQLGDVTYVDLPKPGKQVKQGESTAAVESVKAASDIYAPAGGRVVEVNTALGDAPELVNEGPFEAGWFFKLEGVDAAELSNLMDAKAYAAYVEAQH
ncbi:MAG TPA: glycine cleavage system protein GcvH [Candidatus Hydrogenedentes bacterium]|nr:glycine cleavage system protein GcvH [Candidatus Hydrogenedentota bacterium]HRK33367.1 glycine cleavage system protein GcvH [Candidatus Hydrogenedentota bacterium]